MNYRRYDNSFTVSKISLMGFFLFLPLYKLNSLQYLSPFLDKMVDACAVVSAICLLYLYLTKIHKIDFMFIITVLYFIILGISTVRNKQNITHYIVYVCSHIVLYLYIYIFFVYYKMNGRIVLNILQTYFVINVVLSFFFPTGMYTSYTIHGTFYSDYNFILGQKNIYFPVLMFALVLNELYPNNTKHSSKRKDVVLKLLCLYNIFILSKSATGIIGTLLIIAYPFAEHFLRNSKVIYVYIISLVTLFFGIVVFQSFDGLMNMIGALMGKSGDFTGRTFMWNSAISDIVQHPFLGVGLRGYIQYGEWWQTYAPHSKYLWIPWTGGLLSASVIMVMITRCVKKVLKIYHHEKARYLLWVLFVVGITCLAESYDADRLIYGLLVICFYIERILEPCVSSGNPTMEVSVHRGEIQ